MPSPSTAASAARFSQRLSHAALSPQLAAYDSNSEDIIEPAHAHAATGSAESPAQHKGSTGNAGEPNAALVRADSNSVPVHGSAGSAAGPAGDSELQGLQSSSSYVKTPSRVARSSSGSASAPISMGHGLSVPADQSKAAQHWQQDLTFPCAELPNTLQPVCHTPTGMTAEDTADASWDLHEPQTAYEHAARSSTQAQHGSHHQEDKPATQAPHGSHGQAAMSLSEVSHESNGHLVRSAAHTSRGSHGQAASAAVASRSATKSARKLLDSYTADFARSERISARLSTAGRPRQKCCDVNLGSSSDSDSDAPPMPWQRLSLSPSLVQLSQQQSKQGSRQLSQHLPRQLSKQALKRTGQQSRQFPERNREFKTPPSPSQGTET